ncbi:hypothetical protein ApAK_01945 [Thermoplasmatales archaeon AK]|nr:hypothetical protein [Thermoplasmatales archaeon AK]
MSSKGSAAEGILLKMLLAEGIEAEHGSPSRPGDIIVPPNVIIEVKDPKGNSYSFRQHSGIGEKQWNSLKVKVEKFPWLQVFYVVRFNRKTWRYFQFPQFPLPLRYNAGNDIGNLFEILLEKQKQFSLNRVI